MTSEDTTQRDTDTDADADELPDDYDETIPDHRLDDICGLDDLVERARETVVRPHLDGYHAAAASMALVQTRSDEDDANLPDAIAGELGAAGYDVARLDLTDQEDARIYRHDEALVKCIDTVVKEQPFVLLINGYEYIRGDSSELVRDRLRDLSDSDAAVVIIGVETVQPHQYHYLGPPHDGIDVLLRIPEPDADRRAAILQQHLTDQAGATDLAVADDLRIDEYAADLEGMDAQDIRRVAKRAVTLAVGPDADTVTDDHLSTAIEQIQDALPDEPSGLFGGRQDADSRFTVETPDVTFADVGGLDDTIERIQDIVTIQQNHADIYERAGFDTSHGMLLAGPPGTGKTLLAKALANELDRTFLSVKGPELKHPLYGETERRLRELFDTADEEAPSLIFFDEFDAIARARENISHGATQSVVTTLLTELDGIEAREDLLVVAATNRPDVIDEAILRQGRLNEVVEVPVPDTAAQREIFEIHSDPLPLADAVTADWFVSTLPADATGATISGICEEAFRTAVTAQTPADTNDQDIEVTRTHVRAAIDRVTETTDTDTDHAGNAFA